MDNNLINFETLGFFKEFPDNQDVNYYYWRLNIKHKFFKNLHIICCDNVITVFASEPTKKIDGKVASFGGGCHALLIYEKLSCKNLMLILKLFK